MYNPIDGKCDKSKSNAICVDQFKGTELLDKRLTKGEPDERFIFPLDLHSFEYGEKNPFYSTNKFHKKSPCEYCKKQFKKNFKTNHQLKFFLSRSNLSFIYYGND